MNHLMYSGDQIINITLTICLSITRFFLNIIDIDTYCLMLLSVQYSFYNISMTVGVHFFSCLCSTH